MTRDDSPEADEARFARQVLDAEAEAVARIVIDESFHHAVQLILAATAAPGSIPSRHSNGSSERGGAGVGNDTADGTSRDTSGGGAVVVSGLGKSGLVGQKVSATFASTGTPSHFLHPTEALHGDLGRVRCGDVVVLLSFGGNTDEVASLATILRQDGVPVIAVCANRQCDVARLASVTLCVGDVTEACPMNLAPTASTTAMLALGDALALCVSRARNFGVEDFRKVHPGGALGRQLTPVVHAMRFKAGQNLPLIPLGSTVADALHADVPGARRSGALLIVDADGRLAGIFTDADLRRLVRDGGDFLTGPIDRVMTANPRCLTDTALVRDAVQMVREHRIDEIPVVDAAGRPLGLIDVQDLIALKVIEG